jgi:hypothetical protein
MAIREIRCGNSAAAYTSAASKPSVREDRQSVRLTSRLHVAPARAAAEFRVIGVDEQGQEVLVGLAWTRAEAAEQVRTRAPLFPAVCLQRWVGTAVGGWWETIAVRRRPRPRLAGRRDRRRSPLAEALDKP